MRWLFADESSAGDPCPGKFRWAVCATWRRAGRAQQRWPARESGTRGKNRESRALVLHHLDELAAGGLQQLAGFSVRIFRVSGFDHHKEFVVRREGEAFVFEERMVQARQAVHEKHAENR